MELTICNLDFALKIDPGNKSSVLNVRFSLLAPGSNLIHHFMVCAWCWCWLLLISNFMRFSKYVLGLLDMLRFLFLSRN